MAIGNVNSAVDAVLNHKLTDAAFLSQRGVEKALKAFNSNRTGQPWERTHDPPRLLVYAVAQEPGLGVFELDVAAVNYRMDVRYGEVDASATEAVRAVDIAIRVPCPVESYRLRSISREAVSTTVCPTCPRQPPLC